jgi:hypothetical protein
MSPHELVNIFLDLPTVQAYSMFQSICPHKGISFIEFKSSLCEELVTQKVPLLYENMRPVIESILGSNEHSNIMIENINCTDNNTFSVSDVA